MSCVTGILSLALCATIFHKGFQQKKEVLFQIKSLYKNEDDAEEKDNLMKGLTCAQKIEHLKGILRMAVDKNGGVPVQSISRIFNRVALNPLSNDFLTHFLFENWKAICNRLKNHERFLQRVIGACLLNMHSNAEIMLVRTNSFMFHSFSILFFT
ncbi:hypothetical protein NECAME_13804 [Necator americanus]|uniref:ERAP1-like C-terminal domain-containing protein n=1 Tax=Necator americanus TaxID=51031 RepID=W2SSW1_NECAM|nr:hypothetical protein NECAME_13804 [Necator americanus]ETN72613.1 hypothetical protein NECAME_13804 [Necator americanus]